MLELGLSDPGNLKYKDFHKDFLFEISLYAKRYQWKWKWDVLNTFSITRICEFTETWVVTQRDIKGHYQIALKQGNQNPQNNLIASFSFASTAHVTPNGRII